MQVIPVLDIMGGQVVRGIAGRRAEYRPIETPLVASSDPIAIATAFHKKFGIATLYVADLDAIGGSQPDWPTYSQLMQSGFKLWIDAGIADLTCGSRLAEFSSCSAAIERVVMGLETVPSPDLLRELAAVIGSERAVFSLDLKGGQPLTASAAWQGLSPLEIAGAAWQAGVRQMIVLDLARVGISEGVGTEGLCRSMRDQHPELEIVAGGGVRSVADLQSLAEAGCSAALVGSALHDGRLTREDIDQLRQ